MVTKRPVPPLNADQRRNLRLLARYSSHPLARGM